MNDLQEQLRLLRERVAQVNERYAHLPPRPREIAQKPRKQALSGSEVVTKEGKHWERETFYPAHHLHGQADVGALADLPHDVLDAISEGSVPALPPSKWAFLDIETTGFRGDSDTCAFLVGVGRIAPDGFRVRQFFMRDFEEEASLLTALAQHLDTFRVMITYNGRTFDKPVLETRCAENYVPTPFERLTHHVDLLHGARRLWKLRYESCRLVELENRVLGYERVEDVNGWMIPHLYYEYVESPLDPHRWDPMMPIFEHNNLDILSLACLTGIVPQVFRNPAECTLRHGAELLGIARWVAQTGDPAEARALMVRAVDAGMSDDLTFRALWEIAAHDRKQGDHERALAGWRDLAQCRNAYRVRALEELAKHYEHRAKDLAQALEHVRTALTHEDSLELRRREQRLLSKLARPPKVTRRSTATGA